MSTPLKIFLAALAGAAAGRLVWYFAENSLNKSLDRGADQLAAQLGTGRAELERRMAEGEQQLVTQVRAQIGTQVPPLVRSTIDDTLSRYGITPDTGRRIDRAFALAERVGVL